MMKSLSIIVLFVTVVFSAAVFGQTDEVIIIPKPLTVSTLEGEFRLTKKTKIVASSQNGRVLAGLLNYSLQRDYGLRLDVVPKKKGGNAIFILADILDRPKDSEEYKLVVSTDHIEIAGEKAGAFYALQSLVQSMRPGSRDKEIIIPSFAVADQPRFKYRGMHLDVGRHFMPIEFVKKYIDLMSQYKFNYFHWHLTEDQGWRIEIKKYPKLTEIGSKRPETVKERNLTPYIGDGIPIEGFYTQEQIKDVVAYAKARYITVIPEIELPGHASAALAAYPQFGCKADYKYKVQTTWGIFKEVYCPTDETFKFLEDVLEETIALFPDSPYIHIGGDEVLKDHWKESAFVQELKKRENLKDEHEVQSYFVRRIEKYINSKGKKMIGWDEILEGGLAPNATVMSWRGMKGGIEAAKAKHDVIMTPTDFCYFDYAQGDPAYEPLNIGSYVPLGKVYSFEPVPKELSADEAKYVIGAQANVWTEYMKTPSHVEYMAFPRMLALAEVLWSRPEDKNYADFWRRMSALLARLDKQNINYRIPEPTGLINKVLTAGDTPYLELAPPILGSRVYYTLDSSTPDEKSALFTTPFEIKVKQDQRVEIKAVVVLPTGRKSSIYTATLIRKNPLSPLEVAEKRPGLNYNLVYSTTPDEEIQRGETKSIAPQQFAQSIGRTQAFTVSFDGYLFFPSDDIYEFRYESKGNTGLWIDTEVLFNESNTNERKARSAILPLKAGWHKIGFKYDHDGGEPVFRFLWGIKGQPLRQANGGEFVH